MNKAAQYLVGYHDYRNLCKMDVGNGVVNFCRHIKTVKIDSVCCDIEGQKGKLSMTNEQLSQKQVINECSNEQKKCQTVNNGDDIQAEKIHPIGQDAMKVKLDSEQSEKSNQSVLERNELTEHCPLHSFEINMQCRKSHNSNGYNMCVATIEGQAFLWHQIRAIMAVLFLVGEGKEVPEVVKELLDVEKFPR